MSKAILEVIPPQARSLAVYAGIGLAGYGITYSAISLYLRRKRSQKRKAYPKGVVILHQVPYKADKPTISAPCLKLETWLRVAEIPYQNDFSMLDRSSQGQVPFVTLDGEDHHDSQFVIEALSKKLGKDLSDHLSQVEKAVSRAFFKLTEESLKWCLYIHRFTYGKASDSGLPSLLFFLFRGKVTKITQGQGYGRHTKDEVTHIGQQDMEALDTFIGNKKYLFGDYPCPEDATVFAIITQIAYYDKGPLNVFYKNNCPNLVAHFKNMRATYWPEWKEL